MKKVLSNFAVVLLSIASCLGWFFVIFVANPSIVRGAVFEIIDDMLMLYWPYSLWISILLVVLLAVVAYLKKIPLYMAIILIVINLVFALDGRSMIAIMIGA